MLPEWKLNFDSLTELHVSQGDQLYTYFIRITATKSFLYDPGVSPETEAFKMFYSDLLKNVNDLPTLEDHLSSNGILQKDPDSSRVLPLKRKINLLDKIGSAIATNPQNLEKTLKVLEAHNLVPKTIIARMRSFQGRFDDQHNICKFKIIIMCVFDGYALRIVITMYML